MTDEKQIWRFYNQYIGKPELLEANQPMLFRKFCLDLMVDKGVECGEGNFHKENENMAYYNHWLLSYCKVEKIEDKKKKNNGRR